MHDDQDVLWARTTTNPMKAMPAPEPNRQVDGKPQIGDDGDTTHNYGLGIIPDWVLDTGGDFRLQSFSSMNIRYARMKERGEYNKTSY